MAKELKHWNGKQIDYIRPDGVCESGGVLVYSVATEVFSKLFGTNRPINEGRYVIKTDEKEIPITVNGKNRVVFDKKTKTLIARVAVEQYYITGVH